MTICTMEPEKKGKFLAPSKSFMSWENRAGPAPNEKKIAAPSQTPAFRMPRNLKNPITGGW